MLNNVPVVRAGDTVILCFEKVQLEADLKRMADEVKVIMPGVRVAFMEGVSGLAVFRPDDQPSDMDV